MKITGTIGPETELTVGLVEKAIFRGCHVHAGADPSQRALLRDGILRRCKSDGCWIAGAAISDVTVEHLSGGGRMGTWFRGCVFSNVVLRGRFGSPQWQRDVSHDLEVNRLFDADAAKRYESIDVALDLTEAEFDGYVVFQGIPPALIRRNKLTQFVLRREAVAAVRAVSKSLLVMCKLAQSEPDGVVFTFGSRSDKDKLRLDECSRLQEEGLLE